MLEAIVCFQLRRRERVTELKPLVFKGTGVIIGFWGAYESFQSAFGFVIRSALPYASKNSVFVHAMRRTLFRRQRWLQLKLARDDTLSCSTLLVPYVLKILLLSLSESWLTSRNRESHHSLYYRSGYMISEVHIYREMGGESFIINLLQLTWNFL